MLPHSIGPSPKHCEELMAKENARVKEVQEKYTKMMAEHNVSVYLFLSVTQC